MSFVPDPSRELAGVRVCDTPLVRKALEFAEKNVDKFTYDHSVRAWIFGSLLAQTTSSSSNSFDHEAFSIATILHDLGWNLSGLLVSKDKRFEVDGAIGAREFLLQEAADWDKNRLQLVWDAIALHTTHSIALYKEPEVVATCLGITADCLGPEMVPGSVLTWDTFNRVGDEIPRRDLKTGLQNVFCEICRLKPETTFDNFVGDYGEKYVSEYSRQGKRLIDLIEDAP